LTKSIVCDTLLLTLVEGALTDSQRLSVSARGVATPRPRRKDAFFIMAIYHCTIKNGGRSKGQSAIAAAAYRSASRLNDTEVGAICDYSKKKGVVHSEVSLCENAPAEYADRETLWNAVHKIEKAKDARLWREIEVALPREFNIEKQIETVREYVQGFVKSGMCADWNIHDKGDGNPHAHIMLTTRPIKANGQWGEKEKKDYARDENGEKIPIIDEKTGLQKVDSRNCKQWKRVYVQANDWNNTERVEEWREAWATVCNKRLEEKKTIDHRSYARQGIDQEPTIHEGFAARAIEENYRTSDRVLTNLKINYLNLLKKQIHDLVVKIFKLKTEKSTAEKASVKAVSERKPETQTAQPSRDESPVPSFDSLIAARDEYYRKAALWASADRIRSVNKDIIGLAEKMKKAANNIVERTKTKCGLSEDIARCNIFQRKKKEALQAGYDEVLKKLKNDFKILVKGGVPEYQRYWEHGYMDYDNRLTPANLTVKNAREMVREAKEEYIPKVKAKEEEEIIKMNIIEAAQGISRETIQDAYDNFLDRCDEIPPQHREGAYKALKSAEMPYVYGVGAVSQVEITERIEKTLKNADIQPKYYATISKKQLAILAERGVSVKYAALEDNPDKVRIKANLSDKWVIEKLLQPPKPPKNRDIDIDRGFSR